MFSKVPNNENHKNWDLIYLIGYIFFFSQQVNGDLILTIVIIFKFMSDNLKDLLRFLRRDYPHTRDVFKESVNGTLC